MQRQVEKEDMQSQRVLTRISFVSEQKVSTARSKLTRQKRQLEIGTERYSRIHTGRHK
jgi:hypothetical protein